MIVIGIDPGLKGALAVYDRRTGKIESVHDMPVRDNRVNAASLAGIINDVLMAHRYQAVAMIEKVHGMPRQKGVFNFGFTTGQVHGVLEALGVPVFEASPSEWKARMGLSQDKNLSRFLAQELFPDSKALFAKVKHDGRAEAALLAVYATKPGACD